MISQTGFLDLDDQRLEYRAWGGADPDAPTIVLLHEGLGCVGLWLDFPERLALASGARVFAYSRAGYGASSPVALPRPLDYMTREAQDVLPRVLDALDAERMILVGHSDGATIAAIHAGTVVDDRVRGVVLIAPHFFTEPAGLASIAAAKIAYESADLKPKLARWHTHVDCAFLGWNGAWLDPGFRDWNVEHVLPRIRVPVCVIQGEADAYGTLAQVEAVQRRAKADVEARVLPGIGHSPHRESTAQTSALIAGFVEGLAAYGLKTPVVR